MATQKQTKKPQQADDITSKENPEFIEQSLRPTPGLAEGDRETVEEDLRQKEKDQQTVRR